MSSEMGKKEQAAPEAETGVKRRGLLRFGTLITALTGASAISALGAESAHAGPGDKNQPTNYVPTAEKGAASGVATLDLESKIPSAQLPDFSATFADKEVETSKQDVATFDDAAAAKIADTKSATRGALDDTFAKRREINVADYGAIGDWNGTTGTDNLAALDAAVSAADLSGQPSIIVIGPGDYWLSNSWLIDSENIEVICDPSTVIRTTAPTTTGAAITFMGGGVLFPNNVSTPQRNSFRWKGGKIVTSGSGTADNALGIVRVKNCFISDVTVDADRKGVTSQYGIDNIVWERITVTRAGVDGLAVETASHRVALRDIHVIRAGRIGVNITSGDVGARNSDVLLDGVVVEASTTGVSLGLSDRVTLRRVRSVTATTQDLNTSEVTDLSVSGDCTFATITVGTNVTHKKPVRVAIPLRASWVPFGPPHAEPCAFRTTDGMIILDGAMKSGVISASTKFGTLPVGHRPANRVRFLVQNAGGADHTADIYVEPTGEMFFAQAVASSTIVSLSGIIFPAA